MLALMPYLHWNDRSILGIVSRAPIPANLLEHWKGSAISLICPAHWRGGVISNRHGKLSDVDKTAGFATILRALQH
jgi:hypothetical protein